MPSAVRMAALSLILGAALLGVWQLRSTAPRRAAPTVAALQPLGADPAAPIPVASTETASVRAAPVSEQEPPAPTRSQPVRCWRIGPLDEPGLRAAQERFAASEFTAAVSKEVKRDKVADWIYLPPQPTLAAALDEERRLRDLGVEDVAVVTSGAMRNGLSLGVYAEASGALRRMAALKDLGIDARIEPRYRERRRFYLVVRAVEAPRFDPAASVRPTACSP
ncbi:MAG: hypothetical protein AMXMBFR76_20290 [Pseudomonadota bacterium]